VRSITQNDFNLHVVVARHTFVPIPKYNPFPWQPSIDIGSLSLVRNIEYQAIVIPKTAAINLDMKIIDVRHYESFQMPTGGEKALASAINRVASLFHLDPTLITPSHMFANTWLNENLGVGPVDTQPQSISPIDGFRIVLEYDGIKILCHTDTNDSVRFVGFEPDNAEPSFFPNGPVITVINTSRDNQGIFQRITFYGSLDGPQITRTNQTLQYDENGHLIELETKTMDADRVLVALNPGYTFDDIQPLVESLDATILQPRPTSSYCIYFDPFDLNKMDEVIQALSQSPAIRYVEPNQYIWISYLL